MSDFEQRVMTLDLMRGLGYTVDQGLFFVDAYEHRFKDRLSWADYRRGINQQSADGIGPCQDHKPPWPNATSAQILAEHTPMSARDVADRADAAYARGERRRAERG